MRAVEVTSRPEDGGEPARCASVAGRVREFVRALGAGQVPTLLEQRPQVEGAVLFATIPGALVADLRRAHVTARLVEDAEVQRRPGVAECVRLAVGKFGAGRIASLLEQHPEAETLNGRTGGIDQRVRAPHHLPFPTHP
jgi:hypothetical protein